MTTARLHAPLLFLAILAPGLTHGRRVPAPAGLTDPGADEYKRRPSWRHLWSSELYAAELSPGAPASFKSGHQHASAAFKRHQLDEALAALLKAQAVSDLAPLQFDLAKVHLRLGMRLLKKKPEEARIHLWKARLYFIACNQRSGERAKLHEAATGGFYETETWLAKGGWRCHYETCTNFGTCRGEICTPPKKPVSR